LRGIGSGGVNEIACRLVNAGQLESGRGIGPGLLIIFYFLLARIIFRAIVNHMVKYSPRTLNRTFAALADPTRRRILAHLAHGDRCVTDLARPHAMSLPAVSKHLRVLEKAGLLRRRRYGRIHEMQLDAKPLQQAAQWVEEYRKFWEGSLDRLAEYLEKTQKRTGKKGKN
jgi:DNA-binding transcriptional ArsR family regulator